MKVFVKGKPVEINNSNFLAAGGEGKIYVKGKTVYKICDQGKMIPSGKLKELSVLNEKHIIKPEEIIFDSKNSPIGYTSKYLSNTYSLCQIFTKSFRLRNNVSPEMVLDLVRQMQNTIKHVHKNNIIIVDLNEFNFLLDDQFKDVYFIDVNSYQTKNYKATAIMESIRDRHNKIFSDLTDWFSFAIISFQMFVGIHPYKGKHSNFATLDERMLNNISVLNKEVKYPAAACQSFSVIPKSYMDWYNAVLERGKRLPPPEDLVTFIQISKPIIKDLIGKELLINKIAEFDSNIKHYFYSFGTEVVATEKKIYLNKKEFDIKDAFVGFTKSNKPIAVWLDSGSIKLKDLTQNTDLSFICNGDKIMTYGGRIYIKNGSNIIEILFTEMKDSIIPTSHIVSNVLEHSTQVFDGVIVQNLFDSVYVSVFPNTKECRQISIKELSDYKIVDAKYKDQILMLVGVDKSGRYDKIIISFKDWENYSLIKRENITYSGINFSVLDNGICVHINDNENIEIFHKKDIKNIRLIKDDVINSGMILYSRDTTVLFVQEDTLYSMKVQ